MLINPNPLQPVSLAGAQKPSEGNMGAAMRLESASSARVAAVSSSAQATSVTRSKDPLKSDVQSAQLEAKDLDQAVSQAKEYIHSVRRDLNLNYDEETGLLVIKVVDKDTEEVVRQIPAEEILAFLHNMLKISGEREGVLLKEKV
jgi:flagellar protein FlaG